MKFSNNNRQANNERKEEIDKIEKYCQKPLKLYQIFMCACVCVCVCVRACAGYSYLLLCVDVKVVFNVCFYEDVYAAR